MSADAKTFEFEEDPEFHSHWLDPEVRSLVARNQAKQLVAAQTWTPPERPGSLLDQLAIGVPETDWIVEGLVPAGIVQVNAQYKTGKTTLLMNYVRALATGEPFLGRFPVNVATDDRIGYLNMELSRGQMLRWWADMDLGDDAYKRIEPYHARDDGFSVLDFSNDLAVEWLVNWLRESGIRVLVADPLSKLYNPARWGSDPNAAYTQWWKVLEDVVRRAELRGVIIAHHTGFGEDTADRARGASAMMDNPDVNMSFRHNGDHGGRPQDNKRYLSALGRDVDVPEFELDYEAPARRLTATGGGNRRSAEAEHQAERLWEAVLLAEKEGRKPNKTELFAQLGWKDKGSAAKNPGLWYREALRQGWIETEPGKGNSTLHMPGPRSPKDDQTFAVHMADDEPEADE